MKSKMKKIRTVIIGYGYWGTNITRNIFMDSDYEILAIIETDLNKRNEAFEKYGIPVYNSHKLIPDNLIIDLAVIMTRPSSHYKLATYFLNKKSNILLAKPCGVSKTECQDLYMKSIEVKKKIFCDFTYHFSSSVKLLQNDKKFAKTLKNLQEYVSYRTSLGIVQSDLDVIADLACHDFYILKLLTKSKPKSVQCLNLTNKKSKVIKSALINLRYKSGLSATIHVGWNSPSKVRRLSFVSENSGIILDENDISSPVKFITYKPEIKNYLNLTNSEKNRNNTSYSKGELYVPVVITKEPLALEFNEISKSLMKRQVRLPTIVDAIEIWGIIEACRVSLKSNDGRYVNIK